MPVEHSPVAPSWPVASIDMNEMHGLAVAGKLHEHPLFAEVDAPLPPASDELKTAPAAKTPPVEAKPTPLKGDPDGFTHTASL